MKSWIIKNSNRPMCMFNEWNNDGKENKARNYGIKYLHKTVDFKNKDK
ncbi:MULTISPECIES: hypothetical protein [Empedobacter]|nr:MULTISPECIES: hypothetical protein [Empedobacter]MDH1883032.1 hypothetical protein [Empedobacter sp. GD03797]